MQRRLFGWILGANLLSWIFVIFWLANGGRPDPSALRAAATLLDGNWRFHVGDDLHWAEVGSDDGAWELIDLTAKRASHDGDVGLPDYVSGWMAHGHPGYTGYAWYRRVVDVPPGGVAWEILGPTLVEDGYELYWNGRLLGGSGWLGLHPRVVGTRPLRFSLPVDAAGSRGVLAIRVFELSRAKPSAGGGGIHSAPILAARPVGDALHRAHWDRTIAGYIVDAVEPLLMFALAGVALWCTPRSSQRGFLIFTSLALALTGARRLNNALVSWTDLVDLPTYSWMAIYMWIPTVAAWAMAWNRWMKQPWRTIDAMALAIMLAAIIGAATHSPTGTTVSRYLFIALFALIGARILRGGALRIVALITLTILVAGFFSGEILDPLHIPGIWFPFGIGVSRTQYIYAIFIPLIAYVIVRTLDHASPTSISLQIPAG